jgi:VWFA-related protein
MHKRKNMKKLRRMAMLGLLSGIFAAPQIRAQAPEGPMTPQPGLVVQQAPAIKVQTILVNTPVTVRNTKGEMVNNLEESDFLLTDNGLPQKIDHFELGGDAISLVVVVETSSRVRPMLPEVRKSGILLTQIVMGSNGETAVVGFNDEVKPLLEFTTNQEAVEKTVRGLEEGTSGAKLYDAMSAGVDMLSRQPETIGSQAGASEAGHRRIMLILAEAHDTGSEVKLGEVLRRAQLANITIYSVGLSTTRAELQKKPEYKRPPNPAPDGTFGLPPIPGSVQTPTTENNRYGNIDLMALAAWAVEHAKDQITDHALEIAATATGGAHMATWRDRSIEKVIDEIGGELHSQYVLSYTPSDSDVKGYHTIKVDVHRADVKVRTRPGYYLAGPEN